MGGRCFRKHGCSTADGSRFESCSALHGSGDCQSESPLFPLLTAGKDLLRRRENTVAMRKSVTHDSADRRPAGLGQPGGICSIGVEGTHLPSKQVSPVRARYAAPATAVSRIYLTAGKDLPAGWSPGGNTERWGRPSRRFNSGSLHQGRMRPVRAIGKPLNQPHSS